LRIYKYIFLTHAYDGRQAEVFLNACANESFGMGGISVTSLCGTLAEFT